MIMWHVLLKLPYVVGNNVAGNRHLLKNKSGDTAWKNMIF